MAEDGGGGECMDVDGVSSGGPSSDSCLAGQDLVNEVLLNISQMEIDEHNGEYRKNILFSSQLALNAKRHSDAIQVLKNLSQLNVKLNEKEMDAIEVAYNDYIRLLISAMKEVNGYVDSKCLNSAKCNGLYDGDKLEDPKNIEYYISTAAWKYISNLEEFLLDQIQDALEVFKNAILESRAVPTKAFYWKMIGDIYRICDEHNFNDFWKRRQNMGSLKRRQNMGSLSDEAYLKAWLLVRYDVDDLIYIRNKVKKSYMLHPRAPTKEFIVRSIFSGGVLVKETVVPYFECLDPARLFYKKLAAEQRADKGAKGDEEVGAEESFAAERRADKGAKWDEEVRVEESFWTTSMFPPPKLKMIGSTKNVDDKLFRLAMKFKRYDDAICVVPYLLCSRTCTEYDETFMDMMQDAYNNYYASIKSVVDELLECRRTEEAAGRSSTVRLITNYINYLEDLCSDARTKDHVQAKRERMKRERMKRQSDEAGECKETIPLSSSKKRKFDEA